MQHPSGVVYLCASIVLLFCQLSISKHLTGKISVRNHKPIIRQAPDGRLISVTYQQCVSATPKSVSLKIDGGYEHVFNLFVQSIHEWGFTFVIERVDNYRNGPSLTIPIVRWRVKFDTDNPNKNPCLHDKLCSNTNRGHTCECGSEFDGKYCDVDLVHCVSSPCANGGKCNEEADSYNCTCAAGYTGINCETKIPSCFPARCQNNGICLETNNSYECLCGDDFGGDNCEFYAYRGSHNFTKRFKNRRTVIETIVFPECLNLRVEGIRAKLLGKEQVEGRITAFDQISKHSMRVWAKPVNKGDWMITYTLLFGSGNFTNDCNGRGSCANNATSQTCTCDVGFHGVTCEKEIIPCSNGLCKNGGICSENENGFYCECTNGFSGETCNEWKIEGRTEVPKNEIFCTETRLFEVIYEECHPQNAIRIDAEILGADRYGFALKVLVHNVTEWGFAAETMPYYVGRQSGTRSVMTWNATFDAASHNDKVCLNGGFCHNSRTGRKCYCLEGFTGEQCQTRMNA